MRAAGGVTLFLCLSLLGMKPVYAETERQRCQAVAKAAFEFAKARDAGISPEEIDKTIKKSARTRGKSDDEMMVMYMLAGFVYSDLKRVPPERIRSTMLSECR